MENKYHEDQKDGESIMNYHIRKMEEVRESMDEIIHRPQIKKKSILQKIKKW
jgi:hypothetical protein